MEGIIDKENERVRRFFALLDDMEKKVERLARDNRPPFNGERFLTDRELSGMLKISRRCLQDYRDVYKRQGSYPTHRRGSKYHQCVHKLCNPCILIHRHSYPCLLYTSRCV